MNNETIFASLKMIVLFLSLPATKMEWPWVNPEEEHQEAKTQIKNEVPSLPNTQDAYNQTGMAHAATYLMNAVFVLMTTNYTMNPAGYYFQSNSNRANWLVYFPIFQVVLGGVYGGLKIYTSD